MPRRLLFYILLFFLLLILVLVRMRPKPSAPLSVENAARIPVTVERGSVPPAPGTAGLRVWLERPAEEFPAEDALAEWIVWAKERRTRMADWIAHDPARALAEAVTPRQHAALPPRLRELVERPVAAEAFYGVQAVCTHGPEEGHGLGCAIRHEVIFGFGTFDAEALPASIYGKRRERLTEERDSIYGVVLDGRIALHEDAAVLVDDGPGAPGGRFAVYHRGTARFADTLDAAQTLRAEALGPE